MTAEREWEPGDPIYPSNHQPYQGYFYNFRPMAEYSTNEDCTCPDRASWPEPLYSADLDRQQDPFERFIEEYHQWRGENA